MKTQKTILVVEDEKSLRNALTDTLRLNDFIVLEAKNGREGVDVALKNQPDLILLDLVMPEMDGMIAFKKIREDAWGAGVHVIILTNLSATSEQLVEDIVTHKPAYYLIKSDWKIDDVLNKINEILETQSTS